MTSGNEPERYTPSEIEPKWQAFWSQDRTFRTDDDPAKKKAYILDMFPYPSGAGLHVGHPEGYTATDIVARYLRATGHAVLHPMGWDAFGLPAEQYAIQTGTHPRITTARNIETFRRQIDMLGLSYDWEREVDTTDPAYVKWTQWIFLELFDRGLAFQDEIAVNWCPALGTVLANEEVKDGRSERGNHPVVRTPLRQWMLRITRYADRLAQDLAKVDWPEGTRAMQTEWIGRSEGAEVRFAVDGHPDEHVEIFTTRPDTLFGATFMVLAPEHPLVAKITASDRRAAVDAYVDRAKRRSELDRRTSKEKSGEATGAYAINPVNGARIPIWIADYVLWGYGTGAIMAVPGHDERDFEFATKLSLPIIRVVAEPGTDVSAPLSAAYVDNERGVMCNSGPYDGMSAPECRSRITADLESKGQGKKRVEYKLRDWVFSRQRYWGEPIPVYFPVETTGNPQKGDPCVIRFDQPLPVPRSELPLRLPELEDYKPGDDPAGPLARALDWRFFQKDGKWFARETNTMPQWAGSCWYYLRFMDPKNDKAPFSPEAAKRWLPVDLYVGGAEHAVLHLLYARFWHKVLYDAGIVPVEEPFTKLVHQGMILGEVQFTGYQAGDGSWVSGELVDSIDDPETGFPKFVHKKTGAEVTAIKLEAELVLKNAKKEWVLAANEDITVHARAHKMSKSLGNVVNPDAIVKDHGADALRLYEMFMGPLEATKPWSTAGITGVRRFLDRTWTVCTREPSEAQPEAALERHLHRAIQKVTEDIEGLRFNTAISTLMTLVNDLMPLPNPPRRAVEVLVVLLHPLAPHIAEELWVRLGHAPSVQRVPWPDYDPALCVEPEIEIPVQINGKVRGRLKISPTASEEAVVAAALADPAVQKSIEGKELVKRQYVAGRILTLVVK